MDSLKELKGHLLIVDDDFSVRKTLLSMVKSFGCTADEASNGQDAMVLLKSTVYDLVITDMKMPLMGGGKLVEEIGRLKNQTGKVILITGEVVIEDERLLVDLVKFIIGKPISVSELHSSISNLLENP